MTSLTTERLVLRPLAADDLDSLAALYADPAAVATGGQGVRTRRETAARLRETVEHWRTRGFGSWAATDRHTGAVLGECGLISRAEAREAELALALAPEHWRRGLAAEAAQAALRHGFESLGLHRIVALVPAGDPRPHRAMRRLGMTPEAKASDGDAGLVKYALSRDVFRSRRTTAPATAVSERAEAARRERQERLAMALRRNLRRRKEQGRGRGPGRGSGAT